MFDDGKKKRYVLIGVSILILLLLCILIAVVNHQSGLKNGVPIGVDINNGVGNVSKDKYKVTFENNSNTDGEKKKDEIKIKHTQKIVGKVSECSIEGTYGKLKLSENDKVKEVELKIGSIVFDAKSNKVVDTTAIKKDSNIDIYTYSDVEESVLDIDLAEVVILNAGESVGYTAIEDLKRDNRGNISFKNNKSGKEYKIEGKLYSALNGTEYDEFRINELEVGDKVIYYGSEKDNKVIVDKCYVYPTFK